jgi:citrate lyase beta subunit
VQRRPLEKVTRADKTSNEETSRQETVILTPEAQNHPRLHTFFFSRRSNFFSRTNHSIDMSLQARSLAISLLRPRRAMLYTGGDPKKILKAVGLQVDSICLDLEDAVAHNAKAAARVHVAEALNTIDFKTSECVVRINAVGTGLERDDIKAVFSAQRRPDALLVPKVESAEHLRWVANEIDYVCKSLPERRTVSSADANTPIAFIALIENAAAMLNLKDIIKADPRLVAVRLCVDLNCDPHCVSPCLYAQLVFGADDYAADVGATRSSTGEEVQWARHFVHLHAAAARLQSIDMVRFYIYIYLFTYKKLSTFCFLHCYIHQSQCIAFNILFSYLSIDCVRCRCKFDSRSRRCWRPNAEWPTPWATRASRSFTPHKSK